MKVLGVFWGIVGPLIFLCCLAAQGVAENDKVKGKFMAKCKAENATPAELTDYRTAAPVITYCHNKWLAR